jgi:general secretion pathway protein G
MREIHPSRRSRAGFTLVELLVVMLIIAILVSLVTAAVMKGIVVASETQTRAEIGNLEQAIASFMADFGAGGSGGVEYIPSHFVLREDGLWNTTNPASSEAKSFAYLQKMFGKNFQKGVQIDWNGDNNITLGPIYLQGQHCLVFFLGGVPTATPQGFVCQGFSTNPLTPAAPAAQGEKRRGPYFPFQSTRLKPLPAAAPQSTTGPPVFLTYQDPWKNTGLINGVPTPMAYAFFSSNNTLNGYFMLTHGTNGPFPGDCPSLQVLPYFTTSANKTLVFENSQSYQIISAGRDGIFGHPQNIVPFIPSALAGDPVYMNTKNAWNPVTGLQDTTANGGGEDDQSNFSSKTLGNPQQ